MNRYKVEPYAVAADIYSQAPHVGRGGWTWYTGSAGWMYRVAIEYLLGLRVRGHVFTVQPCIPSTWPEFEIHFRHGRARYDIHVENPHAVAKGVAVMELDGHKLDAGSPVPLIDEDAVHILRIVMGQSEEMSPKMRTYPRFATRN